MIRNLPTALALGLGVALALGCSSSSPYGLSGEGTGAGAGSGAAGRRVGTAATSGTSSGGTGQGGGTTSSSSSSNSSSGGSSSGGGTTGSADCSNPFRTLTDCAPNQVEVVSNVVDFCMGRAPITTGTVSVVDEISGAQSNTDGCGYFHFCAQPGAVVSAKITDPGYLPTHFALLHLGQSEQIPPTPGIFLVCDTLETTLMGFGFDPSQAAVIVNLYSLAGMQGQSQTCDNRFDGWTFSLVAADGGAPVTAGISYLTGGTAPDPTLTATTEVGVAVLYNIDPTVGEVRVQGLKLPSDGGAACPNVGTSLPFQFLGPVPLVADGFSYAPYVLP